jgi:hypothetical protein
MVFEDNSNPLAKDIFHIPHENPVLPSSIPPHTYRKPPLVSATLSSNDH